jgi:phosphohistidine phosphatase
MDLILWRHAEAFELPVESLSDEADLNRALTAKGERQAHRMAEWLNQRLPHSTRILVSPARRAQQTAKALERNFKTVDALAPHGNAEDLIRAARWPQGNEPVLIVGHQPTLGLVAAELLSGAAQAWTLKKGAVWWLRHRVRERDGEGAAQVVLQAVQAPDYL